MLTIWRGPAGAVLRRDQPPGISAGRRPGRGAQPGRRAPPAGGGAARRPALPNKSVILAYLLGGPGQLDTCYPKLNAPAEYRGEFKPIKTNVRGVDLCELSPRQAALKDRDRTGRPRYLLDERKPLRKLL